MATTNAEIIQTEMSLRGIEEDCHTFNRWKEIGFSVKKGEKAIFSTSIWKYSTPKTDSEGNDSGGYCFMKKAHFFKESQVQLIEGSG